MEMSCFKIVNSMTAVFKRVLDYCLSRMSGKELICVKDWARSATFNLFLKNGNFFQIISYIQAQN